MQKNTYTIGTLQPGPSMSEDRESFTGTYKEAVRYAQVKHMEHGLRVCVYSDGGMYWWHHVADGVATDCNAGSGVPSQLTLPPKMYVNIHGRSCELVKLHSRGSRGYWNASYRSGSEVLSGSFVPSQITDTPLPEQQCVRQGC